MRLQPRQAMPLPDSAAVLAILVFGAATALFAYAGSFARYWADDYCYSAVSQAHGLLGGMWFWYMGSGNRFSTILMVTLSEWFGPRAIAWIPALTLVVWTSGWWFFLTRLARAAGRPVSRRWLVLLGLVQVYFCALLAPDRLQSLYWRMGTLHYTFPLGLMLLNLGWMAGRWQREARWTFMAGSGVLAFFAAGFSETFVALQVGVLLAGLAGGWLLANGRAGRAVTRLVAGALVGSLLAMVVMFLSPSNAWRQAEMPPPDSLVDLVTYTLRYTTDFVWFSLRGQPVPLAVFALAVGLIVFLMLRGQRVDGTAWRGLAASALSLLVGFGLVVCCFAPSAYAGLLYPAGRALMPARFAFLLGLGGAAAGVAWAAQAWLAGRKVRWAETLAALLLLAVCFYPVRLSSTVREEIGVLAMKAQRWDSRDAEIRAARAAGELDVVVREMDVVQGLEELNPDPDFWVNTCARQFYDVASLSAER